MNLKNINYMVSAGDIKIHTAILPPGLYGFVYYSRKGRYHILISEELSPGAKYEVLLHEIHHIIEDMPRFTYAIGLDKQWGELEKRACCVARECYRKYTSLQDSDAFVCDKL